MNLHLLGICGTFMGGLALLARSLGHRVSGSDANVYPPMSTQLADQGVDLCEGYRPEHIEDDCDQVIIGNALSRGNAAVESVLDRGLTYTSGAQWLAEHVLAGRRVVAVAGTHGKTTTASLVAHVLEQAGLSPGFLIGGVPLDFGVSARLGDGEWFVVEADEYDTAFFDKRSKFVHYRPEVAILNNLEFDHADIFPDLAAIQTQFHHLVRTIPGRGRLVVNGEDRALAEVLERGCWTPVERFGFAEDADWVATPSVAGGPATVTRKGGAAVSFRWSMAGRHNLANATAACAAAAVAGVSLACASEALASFLGVRRRLELLADAGGIRVFDDFAHHPTAIAETIGGLRQHRPEDRIVVVLEPRSNSMRMGAHAASLGPALEGADRVLVLARAALNWDARAALGTLGDRLTVAETVDELLDRLGQAVRTGDAVVFMSNGGFEQAPARFVRRLGEAGHG